MKCINCGKNLPEESIYCPICGREVQIVPDYNPLDEVLAAQIKGAINGEERKVRRPADKEIVSRNTRETKEQRRRNAEKKKARIRRRRMRMLSILGAMVTLAVILGIVLYSNSYTGQINKGNKAFEQQDYKQAQIHFEKALAKDDKNDKAYAGLAKVFIAQGDLDTAENMFLGAIEKQPDNVLIHKAFIQFYLDTDQEGKISVLLEGCNDRIRDELEAYVSEGPVFSMPDDKTYDDVQELSLKSDGDIYFTLDDTAPATSSDKYKEPISLQEGTTVVRAISVNKEGIPSLEVKKIFKIELPIQDAPPVTPSTGQYDTETMIEIKVPEGYTAYYTMDNSVPTELSKKYEGPIPMPEGNTFFSAVLINGKGRASEVTRRNYELVYNEDSEE